EATPEAAEEGEAAEGEATDAPAEEGQAQIGGDLILYACLIDPEQLQVLFDQFLEQTGVNATCLDMSSGEALERIRAENENPQGDVLFGATNLSHVNLAADGLSQPYQGA